MSDKDNNAVPFDMKNNDLILECGCKLVQKDEYIRKLISFNLKKSFTNEKMKCHLCLKLISIILLQLKFPKVDLKAHIDKTVCESFCIFCKNGFSEIQNEKIKLCTSHFIHKECQTNLQSNSSMEKKIYCYDCLSKLKNMDLGLIQKYQRKKAQIT